MSDRVRSRDVSSEDLNKQASAESCSASSSNKRQSTFNKTADVDDPPFSRLFLLVPKAMSEDELRKAFLVHGKIQDIHMVRDRRSQESKGIAYIKYEKASAAARAMEEMNGVVIPPHARPVKAIISSSRREGSVRDPDEHEKMLRLFVVISKHMTKDDLRKVFEKYGSIIHIKIIVDKLTGENKGFAYISFSKASEAAYALEECDPYYFIVRYKSCQFATYAREKLHAFQFPDGEILSVQYYDEQVVNDLINQSQNGKYGDTSGIGQLIHQMSNLQGSQEQYVEYCNIPLPPKQKYASFDAPVAKTLQVMPQRPISEDYIRDVFNRFGNLIDVRMINPQVCHVMFSDETSADTALETMNGQEIAFVRIRIVESDKSVDSTTASVVHRKRQKV
ncbi:unnamed protein product [Rotaria magnacalcarata]|uniref:RRM domain-containing protein n=1 Tax=Rotaria magnacalcarata TaxID=392030 RepID=A0A8S2PP02_9BILA|nr:unnamed protein product [Rotaria magnacalcarata]